MTQSASQLSKTLPSSTNKLKEMINDFTKNDNNKSDQEFQDFMVGLVSTQVMQDKKRKRSLNQSANVKIPLNKMQLTTMYDIKKKVVNNNNLGKSSSSHQRVGTAGSFIDKKKRGLCVLESSPKGRMFGGGDHSMNLPKLDASPMASQEEY